MATVSRLFVDHRYEVNLFYFIVTSAIVSKLRRMVRSFEVAGASVPINPWADAHIQRRQQICNGDPSQLTIECLRPLENDANIEDGMDVLDVNTQKELKKLCRDLIRVRTCVTRVYLNCGEPDQQTQITVRTVLGVAGYICSKEGKRLVISEQACWQDDKLDGVFDSCVDKFNSDNVCSDVQEMRKCIKSGVRKICNRRAAKFVDKVIYYGVKPIAQLVFNCDVSIRIPRSLLNALAGKRRALN